MWPLNPGGLTSLHVWNWIIFSAQQSGKFYFNLQPRIKLASKLQKHITNDDKFPALHLTHSFQKLPSSLGICHKLPKYYDVKAKSSGFIKVTQRLHLEGENGVELSCVPLKSFDSRPSSLTDVNLCNKWCLLGGELPNLTSLVDLELLKGLGLQNVLLLIEHEADLAIIPKRALHPNKICLDWLVFMKWFRTTKLHLLHVDTVVSTKYCGLHVFIWDWLHNICESAKHLKCILCGKKTNGSALLPFESIWIIIKTDKLLSRRHK